MKLDEMTKQIYDELEAKGVNIRTDFPLYKKATRFGSGILKKEIDKEDPS